MKADTGRPSLFVRRYFAHTCEERKTMTTFLILALLCGGWGIAGAAIASLRSLPRSNDDMVFF
jgi:hypothetical protein